MIKAKDLRIGNYIKRKSNHELLIVDLDLLSKAQLMPLSFEPIELTEDILLKCGITQKYSSSYVLIESFWNILITYDEDAKWWNIDVNDEYFLFKIKYLHELQNAYYMLSEGEELEIKL